jgi:hypothetical protein
MASFNLKSGPPLSALNAWPSSSKATAITVPPFLPWISWPAFPYRVTFVILEFLKTFV